MDAKRAAHAAFEAKERFVVVHISPGCAAEDRPADGMGSAGGNCAQFECAGPFSACTWFVQRAGIQVLLKVLPETAIPTTRKMDRSYVSF